MVIGATDTTLGGVVAIGDTKSVLIVGAGIAGLSAARSLTDAGWLVSVSHHIGRGLRFGLPIIGRSS